ncbi:MAG: DUF89 family protein [Clostridiales bacterium]|nr:DUF89 family protein [Clostridiales bacterium]
MKLRNQCIECLEREVIRIAKKVSDDFAIREDIKSYGANVLKKYKTNVTAPYITGLVYDYAKEKSGVIDPYHHEKSIFNKVALEFIDQLNLNGLIQNSKDAFDTALRLSIAGNIIDFSLGKDIKKQDVKNSIDESLHASLFGIASQELNTAIKKANRIMFISDNAGEIAFDKLLVKMMDKKKVTYVVKGSPIVNDATMSDAVEVGMDQLVTVIDNGAAVQGTLLDICSDSYKKAFEASDLIIAKGQANYETLGCIFDKKIYFLLRAKCKVIADNIGCPQGSFVLLNNHVNRDGK